MVRRVSNGGGLNNPVIANNNRRTSMGPNIAATGTSGLPRVTRSISARQQDLASAGATAAMTKRA